MTTADRAGVAGQAVPEATVPGRTRISARALEHLAVRLVGDAAQVAHREISVRLADAGGALRLSVTVPVALGGGAAGSIPDRGERVRRRLVEGMRDLAGRRVDVVDLRYSGVRRVVGRRVR
ncbi:hypothetical protein [Promicromonospora iranensis]|uniref:Asp23/Gls24 family envelope stress response protein n=1 Tax=Promicromonospora iranensis TaxID=1105144 RepID=A0ABU2CUG6_9MICO|nr:hypothetical protein [Promicromonospora iranensis]MDR7384970.1 hypothetical protein [Promicromonospora iranensis]